MSSRYLKSEEQLARARKVIPLGAQTFSKSITQFPQGVSPYFARRAKGSRVWDVDGNEYVDFASALAAISLGYADADVNAAVSKQLADGTIYSLSHPLEAEVAELICDAVPCAEAVRFGKNGSDATAGAIRIARAYTGRDHVLVCGYHGWQDWYIGATARNKGVPQATSSLTHTFPYNDLPALEALLDQLPGQVAAVILEPMNATKPADGYLQGVKTLTAKAGAILVFDETITGFRYALGGAQERFGVTPDLATFGKALANGFPLSAVAGRRDIMMEMEHVFFSFTMGGETLSLAAAKATIEKLRREPVIETVASNGARLMRGAADAIEKSGCANLLGMSGDATWSFLTFKDGPQASSFALKTLWLQELFARGFLSVGTHLVTYAHTPDDVDGLIAAYNEIFPLLADAAENGTAKLLKCEPLEPLFKVR
ncbi:aminotransferase class III-fold pyridoxal phosphate-dependent enzyme [Terricaulis sp.]|uniref:aminotransferase class III-fold pyridoxal phosphate-dependent enzyme n=1 Tax=Terricaulis sp. TaxID=2768686 RepID=UPI003783E3E5